ncbi:class I SAM-dependent methyltransferase [Hyalangium rubrum]|uniref:Methyltransferase domain-containing protein n=1 Tax=Hyalangium rubrum TaxID=3103134 RepID=A0ABU5HAY7_9BACT|nr:methyltransferase domain-containing protein [Hyalangium sp. s54d21]MDY7230633.1 methyltransferase domain-containing protein [Hyalangium sp. s54d21]
MRHEPPTAYARDLAYVHHDAFGHLARDAAPVVLGALRRVGLRRGLIVDLGCGSGILARALTEAGYDVLGVDLSPDMLRLAARNAPRATFRRGSLLDMDFPPCVAVTAIGEPFNYVFDPRSTPAALSRLFRGIHGALEPGGFLLSDVAGPGRIGQGQVRQTFWDRPDWNLYLRAEENRAGTRLTRDIVLFRRIGSRYRRSEEHHTLRLYPPAAITERLTGAGFQVRRLRGYVPSRLRDSWPVYLARKPR